MCSTHELRDVGVFTVTLISHFVAFALCSEHVEIPKLGIVWVFVHLIFGLHWPAEQKTKYFVTWEFLQASVHAIMLH